MLTVAVTVTVRTALTIRWDVARTVTFALSVRAATFVNAADVAADATSVSARVTARDTVAVTTTDAVRVTATTRLLLADTATDVLRLTTA